MTENEHPIPIVFHAGKGFVWDADGLFFGGTTVDFEEVERKGTDGTTPERLVRLMNLLRQMELLRKSGPSSPSSGHSSLFFKDWLKLRRDHRIVGTLVGCLANIPRQDAVNGMPMVLLPEELTLILEKNIGVLMKVSDPFEPVSEATKEEYNEYQERIQKEQVEVYEMKRKAEVRGMIDRIVEGKKRKMARGMKTEPIDEESIYEAEMARVKNIESGVFVQIPTVNPWLKEEQLVPGEWPYPKTPLETLKCQVFKDLWERGMYLTNGSKFGGDFLAYPGEPFKFHAFYIVLVSLPDSPFSPLDVVRHARLGTHTKKTFVIATIDSENHLTYSSFEWTGKT